MSFPSMPRCRRGGGPAFSSATKTKRTFTCTQSAPGTIPGNSSIRWKTVPGANASASVTWRSLATPGSRFASACEGKKGSAFAMANAWANSQCRIFERAHWLCRREEGVVLLPQYRREVAGRRSPAKRIAGFCQAPHRMRGRPEQASRVRWATLSRTKKPVARSRTKKRMARSSPPRKPSRLSGTKQRSLA